MPLKVGDNISTDEISPAGARALPFRSNIPKLAMFIFTPGARPPNRVEVLPAACGPNVHPMRDIETIDSEPRLLRFAAWSVR